MSSRVLARSLILLSGVFAVAALAVGSSGAEATRVSNESQLDKQLRILNFEEAAALGLDVSIPDGYELCDLVPDWPGYESEAEAEKAAQSADDSPECAADPRLAEYVVGAPPPVWNHNQFPYHYAGWETTGAVFEGGRGELKVRNISGIGHSGSATKFTVGRILVKKLISATCISSPYRWGEAGWSEVSWSASDQRRVYAYGTQDCAWRFYDQQYNIQDGNFYTWRVQEQNDNLNTSILWNDQWQLLHSYGLDCSPTACSVEAYVENYSDVNGEHPSWGSDRLTVRALDLRKGGSFFTWDSTYPALSLGTDPYVLCTGTLWSNFDVLSSGSC